MAFMPLVIAGGMAQAYNEDVASKKEQIRAINQVKTKYLLETGMAKLEARRSAVKASRARISTATSFGFDKRAAAVLESSGELTSVVAKLEKLRSSDQEGRGISKPGIKKMSEAILANVSEENLAKAVNYAFDSGAVANFDSEALIDVIFSTEDGSLEKGFEMVADIPTGSGAPGIGSLNLQLQGLGKLEPGKAAEARKLIESRIAPLLGAKMTPEGWTTGGDDASLGLIVEKALDFYTQRRADPMLDGDLTTVTQEISDAIQVITSTGGTAAQLTQYDFGSSPTVFLKTLPENPSGLRPVEEQVIVLPKTDAELLSEEAKGDFLPPESIIKKNMLPQ